MQVIIIQVFCELKQCKIYVRYYIPRFMEKIIMTRSNCQFISSSRMSFSQNIDVSLIKQNILLGGLEAADACSELRITHIVTLDTVIPETPSYSLVHQNPLQLSCWMWLVLFS